MEYDFNCTDTLAAVRYALKRTIQSFSSYHHMIVCETKTKNLKLKLREFARFVNKHKYSDDYELITAYLSATGHRNPYARIDDNFISSLKQRTFTIQDILFILKQLSLTLSELEQEVYDINENYFF